MSSYRIGVIGRTGRGDYGHAMDEAFWRVPNCQIVAVADDDKTSRTGGTARSPCRCRTGRTR